MRRSYNSDVRTTEGLEITRRLYRGISDIAKRLDEQKSHALTVADIFTPSGEALRAKLRDYCERLIFKDPVSHVRKTEELLWRRGFYDVVSIAKKIRKGNVWSEAEKALLLAHLTVGVGFYHHLILRIQSECNLDLIGVIDFAYPYNENNSVNIKCKNSPSKLQSEEARQCAIHFIHRSLICLGDLARYKLDLEPNWDPMIATRYYKMAVGIDPNIGMPHNQLGTMAGNKNFGLDGVYYYMRCILCSEPFDGAEGNLRRTIILHSTSGKEKNSTHECIAKLLSLLQLWESEDVSHDHISQECQSLLNAIENCLSVERSFGKKKLLEDIDDIETYLQRCKTENSAYLSDDMIFKIMAVCLMSISKLRNKDSCDIKGVIAFTLAVLSQFVQSAILRIQESLIEYSLAHGEPVDLNLQLAVFAGEVIKEEEGEINAKESSNAHESLGLSEKLGNFNENGNHKNGVKKPKDKSKSLLTKHRRRKRRYSSDSDNSDVDGNGHHHSSSSDDMNSDISETEEDALSEENPFSDEALSEDVSDEEEVEKKDSAIKPESATNNQNGHELLNQDTQPENSVLKTESNDDELKEKLDLKSSTVNSESAITQTKNLDSNFEESSGSTNTVSYVAQLKKQGLYQNLILDVLVSEGILAAVKLCCDWLKCNPDIIKACASSSKILMKRLTILLNFINMDVNILSNNPEHQTDFLSRINNFEEIFPKVPLPEDVNLKGLKDLEEAHKDLDWKLLRRMKIDKREQTILRSFKLVEFGKYLCSMEHLGLSFNKEKKLFVMKNDNDLISSVEKEGKNSEDHSRGKLMRHMGRLWLKAEVRALECRLKSRLMSPYLVPDHEALAKFTPALKRLVFAKKFIIIIPAVVVSALDEVKRTSGRAREATRWLEGQLRRGSRFLRAQRPHERLPLPLIKGPRPKDKEAWFYFQIIECCHYLTQQSNVEVTSDSEIPVVTLLTGCTTEEQKALTFNPSGLANSAGVNLEHIEAFHTKWKASSKSHG